MLSVFMKYNNHTTLIIVFISITISGIELIYLTYYKYLIYIYYKIYLLKLI